MKMITVISFLVSDLPGLCSATSDDGAPCLFPLQVNTDTNFVYRYLKLPEGVKRINFEVKANNDVHIALSAYQGSMDLYEIVFGAGTNTFSTIRRCSLCSDEDYVRTEGIVSQFEFRRFWITFGCDGTIGVGRNGETLPFLKWNDPNPLLVNYIGYSTGWGSSGEFRFCNFGEKYDMVGENFPLSLACPADSVIHTTDAFYGYDSKHTTNCATEEGEIRCSAFNSKQIVSILCNNQQCCTALASNEVFGDPCVGVFKYLRVSYMCISGEDGHRTLFSGEDGRGTSPLPPLSLRPVSTEATQTNEETELGVTSNKKQNTNFQDLLHKESMSVWSIVTICVMGLLLLLSWIIFLVLKMTESKRRKSDTTEPTPLASLQPDDMCMAVQNDGFQKYRESGRVPFTTQTYCMSPTTTVQAELESVYEECYAQQIHMTG